MPDSTHNADEQVLSIRTENPGFSKTFLTLVRDKQTEKSSFFQRILDGSPSYLEWIPIQSYSIEGNHVKVTLYEGANERGSEVSFLLADVLYALSPVADTSAAFLTTLSGEKVLLSNPEYE